MSNMIRCATRADAASMLEIYAPFVRDTTISFEYVPPTRSQFEERIDAAWAAGLFWLVCEIDGVIAGYAYAGKLKVRAAYQWNAELSVYISPAFHRRGIARALYRAALGLLTAQGYLFAFAIVTIPNPRSIAFHEAIGFQVVARYEQVGFKHGSWLDVAELRLPLGELPALPTVPCAFGTLDAALVERAFTHAASFISGECV